MQDQRETKLEPSRKTVASASSETARVRCVWVVRLVGWLVWAVCWLSRPLGDLRCEPATISEALLLLLALECCRVKAG